MIEKNPNQPMNGLMNLNNTGFDYNYNTGSVEIKFVTLAY